MERHYNFEKEFEKLEDLGVGQFGSLFKVKNIADGQVYIVEKVKYKDSEYSAAELENVFKQLEPLIELKDDYIVRYYRLWIENNNENLFIQKQFCSYDLKDIIDYKSKAFNTNSNSVQNLNSMEFSVSLELMKGLLRTVQYLHELESPIVHTLLTTRNVFIELDKHNNKVMFKIGDIVSPKLDFERQTSDPRLMLANVRYIAPEVLNGEKYNTRADVYSLAVIMEQIFNINYDNYEDLTKHSKLGIQYKSVWKVLAKMRSPDWKLRPTCAEVLLSLDSISMNSLLDENMINGSKEIVKSLENSEESKVLHILMEKSIKSKASNSTKINSKSNGISNELKKIVISYVRTEATNHAISLKEELCRLGCQVFLDRDAIEAGHDWVNVLNTEIQDCILFVALVTPRYDQNKWTLGEINLANIQNKFIIPIKFLNSDWPPRNIAIQIASIQYIPYRKDIIEGVEPDINSWDERDIKEIAKKIKNQYIRVTQGRVCLNDTVNSGQGLEPDILLPRKIPEQKTVVISAHPKQSQLVSEIYKILMKSGLNVWASTDRADQLTKTVSFKKRVDSTTLVVMILSEEYIKSTTSIRQAFYCGISEKLVVIKVEDKLSIPYWLKRFIDNEKSIQSRDPKIICEKVSELTASSKPQLRSNGVFNDEKIQKQSEEICKQLPQNKFLIYIVGSNKFFNHNSESICKAIGQRLARISEVVLISDGCNGVAETVAKSFYDERQSLRENECMGLFHIIPLNEKSNMSSKAYQTSVDSFQCLPFGDTIRIGDSYRERNLIVGRAIDHCIVVEGGPRTAVIAEEFVWNDHFVIPIACTGGAAAGQYDWSPNIHQSPPGVNSTDWNTLFDSSVSAERIAESVNNIILSIIELKTQIDK